MSEHEKPDEREKREYSPLMGEIIEIRNEVDSSDKNSNLHRSIRYVAAGMRAGHRVGLEAVERELESIRSCHKGTGEVIAELERELAVANATLDYSGKAWKEVCEVLEAKLSEERALREAAERMLGEVSRKLRQEAYDGGLGELPCLALADQCDADLNRIREGEKT